MAIKIRQAAIDDVAAISKIFHQVSIIHYQNVEREFVLPKIEDEQKYIAETIDNKDAVLFVAEENKNILGYLILYIQKYPDCFFMDTRKGFIGSVGVDENYRGKGIGTKLLKAAETYLKKNDIFVFETDVFVFNKGAEKLYNRFGFKDIKKYKKKILK
ncbi:MAG: GNAT family N-acetyltransferase [Alphaproteobacteria bacterium]|nr:GNAT family N-acetyltransferase [Alphaproteobacteria bacterium]